MGRVNKTQFAVLGVLMIRPMSAYDVKQFMARTTAHFWVESEGQLYPTLKKLTAAGDVEVDAVISAKGLPKKMYSIAEQGRQHFSQWMQADTSQLVYRNELLLKVFFGSFQQVQVIIDLLNKAKNENIEDLEQLTMLHQALEESTLSSRRKLFVLLTLRFGMTTLEAEIKWCEDSILALCNFNENKQTQ